MIMNNEMIRYILAFKNDGNIRKIINILFLNNGIHIDLPYFTSIGGILCSSEIPDPGKSLTVKMTEIGRVTRNNVKFTYPFDGKTHFSKDGKILTKVWGVAEKINDLDGHFFSLDVNGIDNFELFKNPSKRTKIVYFQEELSNSYRIVGRWIKGQKQVSNQIVECVSSDGEKTKGCLLFPHLSWQGPQGAILITRKAIQPLKAESHYILFVGGFHRDASIGRMLIASYPADKLEVLEKQIGCLDI
jgi:hypothetical protein